MSDFTPKVLEAKGKTIDEAVFSGMQQMDVSLDEISIETVQEGTKGLFGFGAKPYIVRLTQKNPALLFDEPVLNETKQKPRKSMDTREVHLPKADITPNIKRNDKQKYDSRFETKKTVHKSPEHRNPVQKESIPFIAFDPAASQEDIPQGVLFLHGLLERMTIPAPLSYRLTESALKIRIKSEFMGILIGYRGETLDSLQYLTSLAVNKGEQPYCRVTIDMENYRSKREETLIRLAKKMAAQVRETGEPCQVEPMNAYERRVMHAALQNNQYVTTFSEGEEPERFVVIAPIK